MCSTQKPIPECPCYCESTCLACPLPLNTRLDQNPSVLVNKYNKLEIWNEQAQYWLAPALQVETEPASPLVTSYQTLGQMLLAQQTWACRLWPAPVKLSYFAKPQAVMGSFYLSYEHPQTPRCAGPEIGTNELRSYSHLLLRWWHSIEHLVFEC